MEMKPIFTGDPLAGLLGNDVVAAPETALLLDTSSLLQAVAPNAVNTVNALIAAMVRLFRFRPPSFMTR
ncbi:hypothetical protein [Nocardia sp. NPDC005366]|uniref:hypothetical protein n=1 Tax=Nocardia sp. NPDC005366 TaxID=3156878 RepID=UPI0033B40B7E